jgi:hypothetical protein
MVSTQLLRRCMFFWLSPIMSELRTTVSIVTRHSRNMRDVSAAFSTNDSSNSIWTFLCNVTGEAQTLIQRPQKSTSKCRITFLRAGESIPSYGSVECLHCQQHYFNGDECERLVSIEILLLGFCLVHLNCIRHHRRLHGSRRRRHVVFYVHFVLYYLSNCGN